MALGAGDTTVMKMTNAFAILANQGREVKPSLIDYVQDRRGKVIYRWRFDDGTISSAPTATHSFRRAGYYQVILDAPRSVRGRPAQVADVRPYYGDHSLCSGTSSWITPVKGTVSATTGSVSIDSSSMHPTAEGQDAYARAFDARVR